MVIRKFIDDYIIYYAAPRITEKRVFGLKVFETGYIVCGNPLAERCRLLAANLNLSHVAYIKQPRRVSYRKVLLSNSCVLYRHLPSFPTTACEPHKARFDSYHYELTSD